MHHETNIRQRIERMKETLEIRYPESQFERLLPDEIHQITSEYPDLPEHLIELFRIIGFGCIGDSRFMIHRPTHAEVIYDEQTAKDLASICIVGDDFAGWCVGYDISNNWRFGGIDDRGIFIPEPNYLTFIDLIENWFINETPA